MMRQCLGEHGFVASAATNGNELDALLSRDKVDLVVLDVGLPGEDGLSICRRLRGASGIPIIIVTAHDSEIDRIVGLELGADDYLPKPFNPRELVARVKAVLRRGTGCGLPEAPRSFVLSFEGWRLDLGRRELLDQTGEPRPLSSSEFSILAVFCQNPRKVMARASLLELLHSRAAAVCDRSIDVQISRLRRKIETNAKQPSLIKTVRYGGYIFTPLVVPIPV
jgi:two-component system OmpR family response regulator